MRRPRLLDLYCGAGGCSVGYHRAGFDVVGIDLASQPNYPFEFHQADALTYPLDGFDVVAASPPCQAFTTMAGRFRGKGGPTDDHPDLLTPTLARLRDLGRPYVVENVPGARSAMATTVVLHGAMFGLGVHRPRRFESNVLLLSPRCPPTPGPVGVYGARPDGLTTYRYRNAGNYRTALRPSKSLIRTAKSAEEAGAAMGIDWMTWHELTQAVPPDYTEHIGRQLMAVLEVAA